MKNNDGILDTSLSVNIIKLRDFTGLPFKGIRDSKDEYKLNAVLSYDEELHPFVLMRLWNLNIKSIKENPERYVTNLWLSGELEKFEKNSKKIIFRLTLHGVDFSEKYLNDHTDGKIISLPENSENIRLLDILKETIEEQIAEEVMTIYSKINSISEELELKAILQSKASVGNLTETSAVFLATIENLFKNYTCLIFLAYPPKKYVEINNQILKKIFFIIQFFSQKFFAEVVAIPEKTIFVAFFIKRLSEIGKIFQKSFVNIQSNFEINIPMLNDPLFWELQLDNYHSEFDSIDSINLQDLEELLFNIEYYVGNFDLKIERHLLICAKLQYAKFLLFLKNKNYQLALRCYDKLTSLSKNNLLIPVNIINTMELLVEFFQNLSKVSSQEEIDARINELRKLFNRSYQSRIDFTRKYNTTLMRDDWFEYSQGTIQSYKNDLDYINQKLDSLCLSSNKKKKKKKKKKNKSKSLASSFKATEQSLPDCSHSDLKEHPLPRTPVTLVTAPPFVTIRISQEERDRNKEQKKNQYHSAHQSHQRRKSCDDYTEDKKSNDNHPCIFTLESPLTGEIRAIISDQLRENLSPSKLHTIIEVLKKGKIGFKDNVVKPVFPMEKINKNIPAQVTHKIKATVKEGEEKGQLIRIYGEWGANSYLVFKHELKNPHQGNEKFKSMEKEKLLCNDNDLLGFGTN